MKAIILAASLTICATEAFGEELQCNAVSGAPCQRVMPTTIPYCTSDMPCGLSREDALRQAYQYCREDFWHHWVLYANLYANETGGYYTTPTCDKIAKIWESSEWKKRDDDADARLKQREIDHARAFIEAVGKGDGK